jgi:tetratricopeptide (TPR) repeat protein
MTAMIDPTPLWDSDDPSGSEQRFRAATERAEGDDRLVLMTQVARALGLQERYDEGHAVLDHLSPTADEVSVWIALERGRLLRSAGDPEAARPLFEAAAQTASAARLDALHIDALHMLALVAGADERIGISLRALSMARASSDPTTHDWDATLLNDIGMAHAEAGDFEAALTPLEDAVSARARIGDPRRTRVARWRVAWALRNLGRNVEALMLQRHLRAELDAAGESDSRVDDELALLETEEPQTRE